MSRFTQAERKKSKLRLALIGPSGCGKTFSALRIATGMGGKIAVIDTEHDSASLYATEFEFESTNLDNHSPEAYIQAINDAVAEGYEIVIIDSLSHVWAWCKTEVDRLSEKVFKGNSWGAWSKVTPQYEALMRCIIQSKIHVIATMRSKTETAQVEVNGKKKVVKLGMKTEMKDGVEYEFTTVIDIDHETNGASVSKDRTHVFQGHENMVLGEEIGATLMAWLNTGKDEEPLVSFEQVTALNNMFDKIYFPNVKEKVRKDYPDFSKVKAVDYEFVADKLVGLLEWESVEITKRQDTQQQPPQQGQQQTQA